MFVRFMVDIYYQFVKNVSLLWAAKNILIIVVKNSVLLITTSRDFARPLRVTSDTYRRLTCLLICQQTCKNFTNACEAIVIDILGSVHSRFPSHGAVNQLKVSMFYRTEHISTFILCESSVFICGCKIMQL